MTMKKWKGLMIKEWLLMKHWVYTMLGMAVLLTLILPIVVMLYVDSTPSLLSTGFIALAPLWLFSTLLTPAILLMVSLGKESTRPDIWLHSPISIYELFGVKTLFAVLVGVGNLVLSFVLLMVTFSVRLQPFGMFYEPGTVKFWFIFSTVLLFAAMMIMCIGLFFRVVYLVIRPITKKFSMVLTFGLLVLYIWIGNIVINSSVYVKVSSFGNFGKIRENRFELAGDTAYFTVDGSFFYVGEILLSIGFAGLLFVASALLFEKKVRL